MLKHVLVIVLTAASVWFVSGAPADEKAKNKEKAGPTGDVQGHITFKGKPLPGGTISFHPKKGKAITAKIAPDGTYSAKKVPVGEYRIAIETESVKNPPKGDKKDAPAKADNGAKYVAIPKKFASPETSGLTYDVKNGRQEFNIELSD